MQRHKILFTVCISLATLLIVVLRFWHLGSVPQGLNIDEASYGYDAYSILHTGKDQWGISLPQILKSFGDYKPAALSYLIALLIPLFDLSTFAVRLPSAIAGIFILPILYLTLQELFPNQKHNIFLTGIFALSPWAFGISRLFYESNVGLLFYGIALWLSVRFFRISSTKSAIWIGILFAISGYWYEGLRFTNFFTLILLIFLLSKKKSKQIKHLSIMGLTYLLISLPLLRPTLVGGLTRINQESRSQSYGNALLIDENRSMCYLSSGKNVLFGKICAIFWNKPEERVVHITRSLIAQTGSVYLFLRSIQDDIISPNYGAYLWILFPAYLLGLLISIRQAFKTRQGNAVVLFLILGYLLGCLPGALVGDLLIHRNVSGLYIGFLFIASGMDRLALYSAKLKHGRFFLGAYYLTILFFITQFIVYYFFVYTKLHPEIWHSDVQEIMSYVSVHQDEYQKIYFQGFENAPLYYAFYTKYSPREYQQAMQNAKPNLGGWIHLTTLANIEATTLSVADLVCQRHALGKAMNTLYIGDPDAHYSDNAIMHTWAFRGDLKLRDIYDIDQIYTQLQSKQMLISQCPQQH